MDITAKIQSDASAAAKAQDRPRVAALRLLIDALQKEAKQARTDLDEQGEIAVLKRERKRRAEAAEAYRKQGNGRMFNSFRNVPRPAPSAQTPAAGR